MRYSLVRTILNYLLTVNHSKINRLYIREYSRWAIAQRINFTNFQRLIQPGQSPIVNNPRVTDEVRCFANRWSMNRSATCERKSHFSAIGDNVSKIWQIGDNFTCYVYKNRADNKFVIRCADNTATLVQHAMVKRKEDKERRECSEVSRKEYGRKIADNQCQWPTKHYGMSTCRCPWWRGLTLLPVSSRPLPWYLCLFFLLTLSLSF